MTVTPDDIERALRATMDDYPDCAVMVIIAPMHSPGVIGDVAYASNVMVEPAISMMTAVARGMAAMRPDKERLN